MASYILALAYDTAMSLLQSNPSNRPTDTSSTPTTPTRNSDSFHENLLRENQSEGVLASSPIPMLGDNLEAATEKVLADAGMNFDALPDLQTKETEIPAAGLQEEGVVEPKLKISEELKENLKEDIAAKEENLNEDLATTEKKEEQVLEETLQDEPTAVKEPTDETLESEPTAPQESAELSSTEPDDKSETQTSGVVNEPAPALTAAYISPLPAPSNEKVFSFDLPNKDTMSQSAYLGTLREKVVEMQDEVNVYLTERMEEEKTVVAGKEKQGVKFEEEESKYGEEEADEE